jgi:hypothetical protein
MGNESRRNKESGLIRLHGEIRAYKMIKSNLGIIVDGKTE